MKSARWILAITIAAVLLVVVDQVFGIPNAVGYQNTSLAEMLSRRDFDSNEWKHAAKSNDPIRLKMVDALLRKYRLVGMSRSEVEGLLGPPDRKDHYLGCDYAYWLGTERGFFPIDEEWLGINFQNGLVVEAKDLHD
jgi:hypothetical protein